MNPNQPRKDDVILGDQTRVPLSAPVLGGLFGFKWRLANGSEEQRLAALSEVLKYKEGYDLLTQQALKDKSEKVQQSAYWVLHGHNPYLTELFGKRSPDNSVVPTDTVSCVAISADNQTLAGGSWKTIRLWRFGTGELLRTLDAHSHWVLSVAISPDGKTLASGSADKTIKLWKLKTGQVIHTLTNHTSWVNVVAISPDGQTLISGSADKTIKLWEVNTGKLLRTLKGHSGSVCSLAVSPDGQTLASGSTDKTIKLWDLSTGKLLRTLEEHSDWVQAVAIGSDSETLISGSRDGSIKIWQVEPESENESVVSKSANINLVQVGIFIISIVLAKFTAGTSLAVPLFMFFSQGTPSKKIKIVPKFPSEALNCINTITEHSSTVNSLAIKPDGFGFVSGSDDWTIKLQNLNTQKSLTGHSGFISSVAISPDGKTLVSGSNDWVMLWNLETGELLHPLKGYSRPRLSRIVVSPSQMHLEFGQSQIFSVRGLDQNGQQMNIGQVAWQATGGNIDTNGLFLAGQSEGSFTVTATVGLFKNSASVTVVEPPRLTRLVIAPQQVRLEFGQRRTFSTQGLDQRGNEINIGQVSWYATGGEISTNGTFQAGQNSGSFDVLAIVGEISGYASVSVVEPPRVASLVISPSQVQLEFGQTQRFSVRGLDQYGNGISIGQVTWSATGGTIESNGMFRASYEEGNITITATVGEIRGYVSVTVVEPRKLTTLVVSPQQVQMKPDQRQRFNVRGLDQRGREIALTRVAWKATGGEIDQNGNFIAGHDAKGNFTVTATVGEIRGYASVTVLPVLRQLEISPQEVQLKPEESQSFTVTGFDQQGDEIEVRKVDWESTTGGRINWNGVFIGGYEKREVRVTATVGTISDSAEITLLPVLKRLEISPKQVQLKPKESYTFTIKGFDQYGKEIEIGIVNWNSTGGNIDPDGTLITGDKEGNFTVTSTVQNISGSASVTVVEPRKLTSLVVSPPRLEMKPDQRQYFTVRGLDQRGREIEIGRVLWKATGGEIDKNGTFIAGHNTKGNFRVTATAIEKDISSSADVTVIPVLRRLEIFPTNAKVEPDEILDFVARGFDQRGDEINLGKVDWHTTSGTIDQNGTFMTGQNLGQATIQASRGAINCSSYVMVVSQEYTHKYSERLESIPDKLIPCDYFDFSWFCKTQLFYDGYSLDEILDDYEVGEYVDKLMADYICSSYFKRMSLKSYLLRRN